MTKPKTERNKEIYGLYTQMRNISDKQERLTFLYEKILIPHRITERRMYYIVNWVEEKLENRG